MNGSMIALDLSDDVPVYGLQSSATRRVSPQRSVSTDPVKSACKLIVPATNNKGNRVVTAGIMMSFIRHAEETRVQPVRPVDPQ